MRTRIETYEVDIEIAGDHQIKTIHLNDQEISFDEDLRVATVLLTTYTAERLLLDLLGMVEWMRKDKG